ncbi:MAG TPA: alanine racemase [Gemmatimonadales bacterium]|nr:alanine racemase [Gemmatimonadales bacterium]
MPTIDTLPTPALLLDLDRLDANLTRMAARCRALGVALRPHVKTHKCLEIAERQRAQGARGITVSTLEEARTFADHGFDDITWAFPAILNRIDEVVQLARRVRLGLVVDSEEAVDALEATGEALIVWLKVDCGYHRAGVSPDDPRALTIPRRVAASTALHFAGMLTHSGHAYTAPNRAVRRRVAEDERRAVAELRERLAAEGIAGEASVGSTPAMAVVESLTGVTEARPGNYAFYDGMQVGLGSCAATDCAVTVLASVVSAQPSARHAVIDAGALALSKDAGLPGADFGMGAIYDDYAAGTFRDDARVTGLSQEHGIVSARLPIGARVRVLPNHSCLTAACFDQYAVVRGEEVLDHWRIHRAR